MIVDEPKGSVYGSTVAAPYVGNFLSEALPYLGVERVYSAEEMQRAAVSTKSYVGQKLDSAIQAINKLGIAYEVVGNGSTVTAQMPAAGASMTKSEGKIILYTEGISTQSQISIVPDVVGMTAEEAIKALQAKGLNVLITGATNYNVGSGAKVVSQTVAAKTEVKRGTVVNIRCLYDEPDDIETELP